MTRLFPEGDHDGRAPGTAGEAKTVAYLIAEFQKMGLAPGNPDGTYLQAVPMTGIVSRTDTVFTVGGKSIRPAAIREIVAPSPRFTGHVEVKDSSVVFVGYGVTAPEFGWDDFKGLDVRGKTLIMLIPPDSIRRFSAARRCRILAAGPTSTKARPPGGRRRA